MHDKAYCYNNYIEQDILKQTKRYEIMKTESHQIPHGMFDIDYRSAIFKVGDGVSMHGYTDSEAGTVVEVSKSGKKVKVRQNKAIISPDFKPAFDIGGFSAHCSNQQEQHYTYEEDNEGSVSEYSLRKWRGIKVWTRVNGTPDGRSSLSHGRRKFYDYNF